MHLRERNLEERDWGFRNERETGKVSQAAEVKDNGELKGEKRVKERVRYE